MIKSSAVENHYQAFSLMRLPSEIVRLIVEEVECTQSLVALSQASKQLQMEAERLLYRSLTEPDGTKSFKCLSSVGKSLRRAAYVHAYHVHTTVHKQHRSIWNLIRRTLPLMVNLKELVFRDELGSEPHGAIFPAKFKPHLEKFAWTVLTGNPYQHPKGPEDQSYVSQALKFLEGQTQLRVLHWQPLSQTEPNPKPCPESFFPKLDTLIGDIITLQTFLPGRGKATTLQLLTGIGTRPLPNNETFEQVFNKLSPQLKGIKQFSIQPLSEIYWESATISLQPMITHLYSLETLQVFSLSELDVVRNFYEAPLVTHSDFNSTERGAA